MPGSATPKVLVTRPAREALRWVDGLQRCGIEAQALPLIAIAPAPDALALTQARAQLGSFRAVMFVSANAVDGFVAAAVAGGQSAWPQDASAPRAWATGPGTREALQTAGVPAAQIDMPPAEAAQFDSEALWAGVQSQLHPGDRVLIVRGGDTQGRPTGRDWLAGQLAGAGAQVCAVTSYVRQVPAWSDAQRARAMRAASDGSWWLFSSSEALGNLRRLLPDVPWSQARAVCTHDRIARAAQSAGFGVVRESRPLLAEVIGFLQSQQ